MSEDTMNEESVTKLYELGVNLVPTLEDKTQEAFDALKKVIENKGGKVEAASSPESIPLAYTMEKTVDSKKQKYTTAAFGWIKFTAEAEVLAAMKEDLDLDTNILRYVILKTTPEATTDAKEVAQALEDAPEEEKEEKPKPKKEESDDAETVEKDTEETQEKEKKTEVSEDINAKDEVDEAIDGLVEESK